MGEGCGPHLFHGRVDGGQARVGNVGFALPELRDAGSQEVVGYVRPHDIEVSRERTDSEAPPGTSGKGEVLF